MASRPIDVERFESWLLRVPSQCPVAAWRVKGLDIWPIICTSLASLAVLMRVRQRKSRIAVGGRVWQFGVICDYAVASPIRWLRRSQGEASLPPDDLDGTIVYCGSRIHTRLLAGVSVSAPLDVPATLMRRAGHAGVLWIDDAEADDPNLAHSLTRPARGLASVLRDASSRAWRVSVARELDRLEAFEHWCTVASHHLGFSNSFLRLWLARQLEVAIASEQAFGRIFEAKGAPKLLVMLNGGFAVTSGLTAAAKLRGIPVVEIQHGAGSEVLPISADAPLHFAAFNTGPDALISWDLRARNDLAVLEVGPIGLHLTSILAAPHTSDGPSHAALMASFDRQRRALEAYARKSGCELEVLVSLQPGDHGAWVERIAAEAGPGVHYWVRRHGSELSKPGLPGFSPGAPIEAEMASSSALQLLLARVQVHLTRFSAVALEAAASGVPTIALEEYAAKLYAREIPAVLLSVEGNLSAVARRLRSLIANPAPVSRTQLPDAGRIVAFLEARMATSAECGADRQAFDPRVPSG